MSCTLRVRCVSVGYGVRTEQQTRVDALLQCPACWTVVGLGVFLTVLVRQYTVLCVRSFGVDLHMLLSGDVWLSASLFPGVADAAVD